MSIKTKKSKNVDPIKRWDEPAKCPNCKGELREVGKDEWTAMEAIKGLVSIFSLQGYLTHVAIGWGNVFLSYTRVDSVLRQCSKCGNYVTKCPRCKRKFIPGGRPAANYMIRAKCPFCETKITAWNSCDPPPSDTPDNNDDDHYLSWGGW